MNEYLKRNYEGSTNAAEIERFRKLLRPGMKLLTPRQQQVMKMYFEDDMNQVEIAEKLGIKQQSVSDRLNAAITNMQRYITISLHFQKIQPL